MGARSKRQISEAELLRWRLIEQFEKRLERAAAAGKEPHTFSDPRRKLGQKDYCILGCRHWLAESERGVALQVYCALIAALLLLRSSGRRPSKRAMEMIRFYLLGYATLDELSAVLSLAEKST